MSGRRLIVGLIVMGIGVPLTIFFLLGLHTPAQFFTVAVTTFLAWGLADLLATIIEKPRLENRSPGLALKEDLERRKTVD
jgi:hypothetical protein